MKKLSESPCLEKFIFILSIFFAVFFISSCSSIKTLESAELAKIVDRVALCTDSALSDSVEWTRDIEIEDLASSNEALPAGMILETGELYSWSFRKETQPLYFMLNRNAAMLRILNMEMALYLKTLSQVEDGTNLTEKDFSKLSSSVKKILSETGRFSSMPELKEYQGLISLSAVSLLEAYMKGRSASIFNNIVNENQKLVEDWSKLYISIIRDAAANIKTNYAVSAVKILGNTKEKTQAAKKKQVETIFDLNERLAESLDRLKMIEDAVVKIPKIHSALSSKNEPLEEIISELNLVIFSLENYGKRRKK